MVKKKILFVDDEPETVVMIASRLRANDCEVLTATSGPESIQLAREFKPDLILLDIIMPAMEGYDVLLKLKAENGLSQIPVIVLTAAARKNLEAMCVKAGAKAVIFKPFNPAELLALIKKAFDPNSKWRRAESICD